MEFNNNANPQGAPITEPQGNGKMFTQEEVNQIVSERLKKERAKGEPSEQDKRIGELNAKESHLNCREYLISNGYPADLLEILGTDDSEKFIKNVEKLCQICPELGKPVIPTAGGMRHGGAIEETFDKKLADAFKRK